jgi:hypothetical protein
VLETENDPLLAEKRRKEKDESAIFKMDKVRASGCTYILVCANCGLHINISYTSLKRKRS